MQKGLALLFLLLLGFTCRADVSLPRWNDDAQKAWWTKNPTPDQWPQAATDLTGLLEAIYKRDGVSCFSDYDFQGWLEHLEWIRLGLECPDIVADHQKAFIALGQDAAVSHLFIQKLDIYDVKREALNNLIRLDEANAADLHEYAALGVAYSLVFDRPFPDDWPHPQVNQSAVPIGDLDIVKRFQFYVQSNRNKKTDLDLTELSVENLKFLVDSEVSLSELEYAQHNRISYSDFGQAFFSIHYDDSRTEKKDIAFNWGYPTYNLADIEKHGGICVDQAYYASILGKGRGIPTLYFHGQGTDGGHAWFGYMKRSGTWDLDCGRYESQNYPRGYALDPQTWQVIDDQMLTTFFKNGVNDPNYQPTRSAIAWALLHARDPAALKKILDDARSIMPELAQTWQMEANFLENTGATDADTKSFYQNWIRQFSANDEMKLKGQRYLLDVLKRSKDPEAADLQQELISENRSSNVDVGIKVAYGAIADKIKAADWDGARIEYEMTIRQFAEQGGGTLYYNVISPYINACLRDDMLDLADLAVKFTEERVQIDPDGTLGKEFRDLKLQVANARKDARPR